MPAPSVLAGLPKPILFGLYGAIGGLLGAVVLGEPAWYFLKPPLAVADPQVAVGSSTSVKLYPGTSNTLFIRIARERFEGPVTIRFDDLPSGITLPSLTIPQGETQTEATVSAGGNMAPAKGTIAITAEALNGTLKATTSCELEVSAAPPSLAVAAPDKLMVYTRGEGRFTASIARRGYDEEVAIRIEGLPEGITAAPAMILRGESNVEVALKAAVSTPVTLSKLTVVAEPTAAGLKIAGIPDSASAGLRATTPTELIVQVPPIAPVDVVFVLDVTASMQWALNDLKNGIGKFADALSKAQLNFRLGLVTFQDLTIPGEKVEVIQFNGQPFTSDAAAFRDKVALLKAEGGGDIPESSLEGVTESLGMPFRQGATKVLLLITDAPPKVVRGSVTAAVEKVAKDAKGKGIDSLNVVVDQLDKDTYQPLQEAGTLKNGGKYFDIRDLVRNEGGFDSLLDNFGRDVTAAAMARSSDAKPQVAPPPTPPRVGGNASLVASEAPPPPSIKGVQASGNFAAGTEGRLTLAIGVWTGAIAALLCLALLSGQHHYLRGKFPPFFSSIAGFGGGLLVGFVGGSAGEGLYLLAQAAGLNKIGWVFQLLGWALLGGLAGTGLSLFIPNLKWVYGLVGGAIGGTLGGLCYMGAGSLAGEIVGRLVGGLIVGFFIGLMVAVVEAAFRRAWLEVRFGARETISVNLGPEPVKIGGDAKVCTVWARGAAPLALRFFLRDGQVICNDAVMKRENAVSDGFAKEVGNVTVTVRTGSGAASTPTPSQPSTPPSPKPKTAPASKAPVMDDDFGGLPMPISPPAPPKPVRAPVVDDDFGGLPMPISPPAPSKPVRAPVVDDDFGGLPMPIRSSTPPAAPPSPSRPPGAPSAVPPKPLAPTGSSAKPVPPSAPPKPPSPASVAAKPPSPPAPPPKPVPSSPPPPAASAKHPDACPGCGRVNAGKPKTRYCMVCDQTY